MLRKLLKNKKAQNTAEYAILIALVVGAVIAMQTFMQRGLQGRMRDSVVSYLMDVTGNLGNTTQYVPYYLEQDYNITRSEEETKGLTANTAMRGFSTTRTRMGNETESFNFINGI